MQGQALVRHIQGRGNRTRCPPRHIPVAAIRPLQDGRDLSRSIDTVASYKILTDI